MICATSFQKSEIFNIGILCSTFKISKFIRHLRKKLRKICEKNNALRYNKKLKLEDKKGDIFILIRTISNNFD